MTGGNDLEAVLDFAESDRQAGFRLHRLELYNWGTFDRTVWTFPVSGTNALMTGEIGSGKSTVVDAVATLLVPATKVSYNKAAGAAYRERDLRSYVMGYYKSERSESGYSARPVALRTRKDYSVILAVFFNAGYGQTVTLAQVFWQKDTQGQPARLYLVADDDLTVREHFSDFGGDINQLRRRLRAIPTAEPLFDSFPPYGAAFRRRFGLKSDQPLDLFHQTVSMKSVGNLTQFVREHMLEAFDVRPRIDALIAHFDDLNRAHESVLRAKDQIARLDPLVSSLDRYAESTERSENWRYCRDGLRSYFASLKAELLEKRIGNLERDIERLIARKSEQDAHRAAHLSRRDQLTRDIAENGGDRLQTLRAEVDRLREEVARRLERFEHYQSLCAELDIPVAGDSDDFVRTEHRTKEMLTEAQADLSDTQNTRTELQYEFKKLNDTHRTVGEEIESLKGRTSNIDSRQIEIRARLCEALELEESAAPFVGELLAVRDEDSDWEGAIERLLHIFALSLLVPDQRYGDVAAWVDKTNLKGRLIYYRVGADGAAIAREPESDTVAAKVEIKPDSPYRGWLSEQLLRRFDHTCCTTMEQFRRAGKGITRAGQIKGSTVRHEKDDRRRIDDRRRYVLGWRNQAKIAALQAEADGLEREMAEIGGEIARIQASIDRLEERRRSLYQLQAFTRYEEIHWQAAAGRMEEVEEEIQRIRADSDLLDTLMQELAGLEKNLAEAEAALDETKDSISRTDEKLSSARDLLAESEVQIASAPYPIEELRVAVAPLYREALAKHSLTVESCDNRQQDLREWIQRKIDAEEKRIKTLHEQIIRAMQDFRRDYPVETRDVDADIASGDEYRSLLSRLQADDLPQFEARFKSLLNENTIREIANFQAQLNKETSIIKERVARINHSMSAIEYNKDRYIQLEAIKTADGEIRSLRQELRACTEGTFTGSQEEQYTEAKFVQVKAIIDRFNGREGTAEIDRRWTEKVTDVRNWFEFAASERWKEDDAEYEHYTDSGGKSGGQKEKLAYTVLAASLAYQFGLEWGETRSRSFRFVVIDEAFARGSDESARFGLELFKKLNLQLLIVTPLQKIHIIEPYVATVGFVYNPDGQRSLLRTLTIEEYHEEMRRRSRHSGTGTTAEVGEL